MTPWMRAKARTNCCGDTTSPAMGTTWPVCVREWSGRVGQASHIIIYARVGRPPHDAVSGRACLPTVGEAVGVEQHGRREAPDVVGGDEGDLHVPVGVKGWVKKGNVND